MSTNVLLWLALTALWLPIAGEAGAADVLLGALIAAAAVFLLRPFGTPRRIPWRTFPGRLRATAALLPDIVRDLVLSNLDLARRSTRRRVPTHPALLSARIPGGGMTVAALVALYLTLTPGEMVIDISEDGEDLLLHVIDERRVDRTRWRWAVETMTRIAR